MLSPLNWVYQVSSSIGKMIKKLRQEEIDEELVEVLEKPG